MNVCFISRLFGINSPSSECLLWIMGFGFWVKGYDEADKIANIV